MDERRNWGGFEFDKALAASMWLRSNREKGDG
jgi:hypothetical protein